MKGKDFRIHHMQAFGEGGGVVVRYSSIHAFGVSLNLVISNMHWLIFSGERETMTRK